MDPVKTVGPPVGQVRNQPDSKGVDGLNWFLLIQIHNGAVQ